MISLQYVKELFGYVNEPKKDATFEDLYDYIIESENLGKVSQCKKLINKLSGQQHQDLLLHCNQRGIPPKTLNSMITWRIPK